LALVAEKERGRASKGRRREGVCPFAYFNADNGASALLFEIHNRLIERGKMPKGDGSIEIHSERVLENTSVTVPRASSIGQDRLSCAIDGLHKDGGVDDGNCGCGGWVGGWMMAVLVVLAVAAVVDAWWRW
jgi:hypothetical protein